MTLYSQYLSQMQFANLEETKNHWSVVSSVSSWNDHWHDRNNASILTTDPKVTALDRYILCANPDCLDKTRRPINTTLHIDAPPAGQRFPLKRRPGD